ncbi:hypothetical protein D1B31_04650 [Neobacillus notoginsengisoli]|uniref:IS110 family transposase n=1 Tax=Neobacillus notoginsengisoli TaxID=1578198 RepID=A0A417YWJ6_9BACI|nr:hypothetical protein [Neobacillus notoginsengisoli]RHW41944.1 hypothetical protein D1B31_04650 [Neobacillus notoginsengisoli]
MNPVVGLDVAKGESQVQAFLDKKKSGSETNVKRREKNFKRVTLRQFEEIWTISNSFFVVGT